MDTTITFKMMVASFLTTLLIKAGEGMSCYDCTTTFGGLTGDTKCADTFDTKKPAHHDSCKNDKFCKKVTFKIGDVDHVIRTCGGNTCDDEASYSDTLSGVSISGTQFCCDTNKCNGSDRFRPNVVMATLAVAMSVAGYANW